MGRSPIHAAGARIAKARSEMDVPFCIAGALAVNVHGHMRTTEDVDIQDQCRHPGVGLRSESIRSKPSMKIP